MRRTPGVIPVPLIDTMERRGLFHGLRGIWTTPEGVALEIGESAALALALRNWDDAADEFAAVAGRAGFLVTTTTTVHLVKLRGANHD